MVSDLTCPKCGGRIELHCAADNLAERPRYGLGRWQSWRCVGEGCGWHTTVGEDRARVVELEQLNKLAGRSLASLDIENSGYLTRGLALEARVAELEVALGGLSKCADNMYNLIKQHMTPLQRSRALDDMQAARAALAQGGGGDG